MPALSAPPPPRRRAIAALLGLASAALLASAAPSSAISTKQIPSDASPLKYPGTTMTDHSWKSVGTWYRPSNDGIGATATQVGERWVIASGHSAPEAGDEYWSPTGKKSKVVKGWAASGYREYRADWRRYDFALALLEDPIPAPPGGFPRMIDDPSYTAVQPHLPGWFLLAGVGGTFPKTSVEWVDALGRPAPGRPAALIDYGDSGGVQIWKSVSFGPPVIAGEHWIDSGPGKPMAPIPGIPFSKRQSSTNSATMADLMRTAFAEFPSVAAPPFYTLADLEIPLDVTPPPAPNALTITTQPFGKAEVAWRHHVGAVQRDKYVLTVSPGQSVELPATATSHELSGLQPGTEYTVSIKAVGPGGESGPTWRDPFWEASRVITDVSGLLEGPLKFTAPREPTTVVDLTATASRVGNAATGGKTIDYCINATWKTDDVDVKTPGPWYSVKFDGTTLATADDGAIAGVSYGGESSFVFKRCGLAPGSQHAVTVSVVGGTPAELTRTMPTGPPVGTFLGAARELRVDTFRQATSNKTDYCTKVSWTAPTAVEGLPASSFVTIIPTGTSAQGSEIATGAPTTATFCGLNPAAKVSASVSIDYGGVFVGSGSTINTTPTGAPRGTLLGAVSAARLTFSVRDIGGRVVYCSTTSFTMPAAVDGFPVSATEVVLYPPDDAPMTVPINGTGAERTATLCGVQPGEHYGTIVTSIYRPNTLQTVRRIAAAAGTSPDGPPPGTPTS